MRLERSVGRRRASPLSHVAYWPRRKAVPMLCDRAFLTAYDLAHPPDRRATDAGLTFGPLENVVDRDDCLANRLGRVLLPGRVGHLQSLADIRNIPLPAPGDLS